MHRCTSAIRQGCAMSEWLDGYWTAIRQIAVFGGLQQAPDPWAFWTMIGTLVAAASGVVAGVAAASAAWLTRSIAVKNTSVTFASERYSTTQMMLDLHYRVRELASGMGYEYRRICRSVLPSLRTQQLSDLLDEVKRDILTIETYYVKAARSREDIERATSVEDLHNVKSDLALFRAGMDQFYANYENRLQTARDNGLI